MRHYLCRSRRILFHPKAWRIRLFFWNSAILVGVVAAVFAISGEYAERGFHQIIDRYRWASLFITPLGLVLITWLTRRYFPGVQGSGVPQTLVAMQTRVTSGLLSIRIAIGKVLLTVMGLACGASVGSGGPTVHVGASLMHALNHRSRYTPRYMDNAVIGAGGGAGVAAAFSAPLAGVVFAIEELNRSFELRNSSVILLAVLIASVSASVLLGQYHYLGTFEVSMPDTKAWLAVPICGVAGGLLGGLFSQGLISGSRKLHNVYVQYPYRLAFICGLLIAVIGLLTPTSIHGSGYEAAQHIINNSATSHYDPYFPFAKMLATTAAYLSGIPCGIFAPSLATGAGLGADLGHWLPLAPISVMVLLGMVGYFSGVMQSPITAFVIVMEITNNHSMMLAVIATSLIASGTSQLVCPQPIYRALAQAFFNRLATVTGDGKR